jgi:hypothetical protein
MVINFYLENKKKLLFVIDFFHIFYKKKQTKVNENIKNVAYEMEKGNFWDFRFHIKYKNTQIFVKYILKLYFIL